ncbi:MAG TPA: sugar transferase [Candidatus Sulfotelmatobacter sp.]|nr:sugar transferase [Candidatus Sulfotelmatobacter sp.]
MPDQRLKTEIPAEKRCATGKSLSFLENIPVHREDLFDERTFHAMLALERHRAERSRQSFLLMLFDTTGVEPKLRGGSFPEQLACAVSAAIRESDAIGWYEQRTVLGVIFTDGAQDEDGVLAEVLRSKMLQLMQESFGEEVASQLTITLHTFPESWEKGHRDRMSDKKLYPDVASRVAKKQWPAAFKRAMDVVGSAIFLLIHSPILLVVAVAIKLTSKGPVIYKQERLGQFGEPFQCLKFRTMYVNNDPGIHREYIREFMAGRPHKKNDSQTAVYKITNDPRVTSVGRFLRRTSLDEFPQFWNVFCGEMSLVGPRPPLLYECEAYDVWHRRRILDVKPGVTGLWQVFGRSRTSFDDMVRMDVRYCQRWSIWLDLKILLATPLAVLTGHGAY